MPTSNDRITYRTLRCYVIAGSRSLKWEARDPGCYHLATRFVMQRCHDLAGWHAMKRHHIATERRAMQQLCVIVTGRLITE